MAGETRAIVPAAVELVPQPRVEPDVPDRVMLRAQVALAKNHIRVYVVGVDAAMLHGGSDSHECFSKMCNRNIVVSYRQIECALRYLTNASTTPMDIELLRAYPNIA